MVVLLARCLLAWFVLAGSIHILPARSCVLNPRRTSFFTFSLVVVGIVSGAIPAIRAVQTLPDEALRAI